MKIRFPVEYDRQLQQWLDSYLRVVGHEPSAQEIAEFESRQHIIEPRPFFPVGARQAADSASAAAHCQT